VKNQQQAKIYFSTARCIKQSHSAVTDSLAKYTRHTHNHWAEDTVSSSVHTPTNFSFDRQYERKQRQKEGRKEGRKKGKKERKFHNGGTNYKVPSKNYKMNFNW
jgi:hypothetical protein